jgi:hypothetical protein
MAKYKQAEFAEKCGISVGAVSVQKKRGKIIVDAEGMVDDQDSINQGFLNKAILNLKRRESKMTVVAEEKPEKVESKPKKAERPERTEMSDQFREKMSVETNLKKIQTERAEAESELLKIKKDRINGQLLPTVMIKPLFQRHFQSIIMEFQHTVNALITDISVKTKLNPNVQAELRRKAISDINLAVDRAIFHTEREIKDIASEYTKSKNRAA